MLNKTALITGSGGGIGSEVARDLSSKGYDLILVDIDEKSNGDLAESLGNARAETLDLTDRDALKNFCESIHDIPIDVAFINAGTVFTGDVIEQTEPQIDLQLELNLRSAIMLNRACATSMMQRGSGHIVNTVSMGGITPLKGGAAYVASKFGLRGFLSALYSELKPSGIKVSGIYPSGVDTAMLRYEATHGGSLLNFVSTPQTSADVLKAFNRALSGGKLEVYVPYSDSLLARAVALFPSLLDRLYPMLEWFGRRGLSKYLKSIEKNSP